MSLWKCRNGEPGCHYFEQLRHNDMWLKVVTVFSSSPMASKARVWQVSILSSGEDKVWFDRFGASRNSLLFRMKTKVPPVGTLLTSFTPRLPSYAPQHTSSLESCCVCVFLSFLFLFSCDLLNSST